MNILAMFYNLLLMDNPFEHIEERLQNIESRIDNIYQILEKLNGIDQDENINKNKRVNIDGASEILFLSKSRIYQLVEMNELPHIKKGRRLLFEVDELNKYLDSGRNKTRKEIEEEAENYILNNS
jgi:excisionase family DNA binding protein